MIAVFKSALAALALALAGQAVAQVTFYERENFQGRSFTTDQQVGNFERSGFNDRASSAVVVGQSWEVCDAARFSGRCVVLRPGRYPSLAPLGLYDGISSVREGRVEEVRTPGAVAQVVFYEREGFEGRSFTADGPVEDLARHGFNNRASAVVVLGESWELCESAGFGGRCVVLRPGRYPSLGAVGLDNRVSSVRSVGREVRSGEGRPVPVPVIPQVVVYEREGFEGRSFTTGNPVEDLARLGLNNRAAALVVTGEPWEVCEGVGFGGRCVVLRPGRYPTPGAMGLDNRVASVRATTRDARFVEPRPAPVPEIAQVVIYERAGFEGPSFTAVNPVDDFRRYGFNDRASSLIVIGDSWEICEDARYSGRCVVLRPGRYPSLPSIGLSGRISSVRAVNRDAR